jgi:hypothetical protein
MHLKKLVWECVGWINLAQDGSQLCAIVNCSIHRKRNLLTCSQTAFQYGLRQVYLLTRCSDCDTLRIRNDAFLLDAEAYVVLNVSVLSPSTNNCMVKQIIQKADTYIIINMGTRRTYTFLFMSVSLCVGTTRGIRMHLWQEYASLVRQQIQPQAMTKVWTAQNVWNCVTLRYNG